MRIFSIHKSKSKKQVSEKTPKLAANKFLEKRKVGTVIYLHEHPSGKIHGPYQKDNIKKVMKGGLFGFGPSVSDFLVPDSKKDFLKGTDQLVINRPRSLITREPCIYFGNKSIKKSYGSIVNKIPVDYYYKYAIVNKTDSTKNISSQLRFFVLNTINNNWNVEETTIDKLKKIDPQILLGLYVQYIHRCMENFPDSRTIIYEDLYMRRLFLHLLIHVLPVIGQYIMNIYFNDKTNQQKKEAINKCTEIFETKYLTTNNNNDKFYELYYFMIIVLYVRNIKVESLVNEIAKKYNIEQDKISGIIEKGTFDISKIVQSQNQQSNTKEIMRDFIEAERYASKIIAGIPEQTPYMGMTGSKKVNIGLGIVFSPVIVACATVGLVLAGLNELTKEFQRQNNRSRVVY
jgi:hypothetical protein